MPKYHITAIEHYRVRYTVEADSPENAWEACLCGEVQAKLEGCLLNEPETIEEIKEE